MGHITTVAELFDEIQGENGLVPENPEFELRVETSQGSFIVTQLRWEHHERHLVLETSLLE